MSKKLGIACLVVLAVALVAPRGASAGCTASFTCSNACHQTLRCPTGVFINCSASNEVVTCSGTTSCTVGTNSVQCDSVTRTCQTPTSYCRKASDSLLCGNTFVACPTCGGKVCQSSPQPEPGFLGAPEPAAAEAEPAVAAGS
jgi:hypothetical protein